MLRIALSGAIANGAEPFGRVSRFGSSTTPCRLVDGAFIAVNRDAAMSRGARFDEQFGFHFTTWTFAAKPMRVDSHRHLANQHHPSECRAISAATRGARLAPAIGKSGGVYRCRPARGIEGA